MLLMIHARYTHFRYIHSLDHAETCKIKEITTKKTVDVRFTLHFNKNKTKMHTTPKSFTLLLETNNFSKTKLFPLKS